MTNRLQVGGFRGGKNEMNEGHMKVQHFLFPPCNNQNRPLFISDIKSIAYLQPSWGDEKVSLYIFIYAVQMLKEFREVLA